MGAALFTAIMVGVLLAVLAGCVLAFTLPRYRAIRTQQHQLQAVWNARAGFEHYLAGRLLGESGQIPLSPGNRCDWRWEQGDLLLEGASGEVRCRLTLPGGDPERMSEEVLR